MSTTCANYNFNTLYMNIKRLAASTRHLNVHELLSNSRSIYTHLIKSVFTVVQNASGYGYSGFGRSRFWPRVLAWFTYSCVGRAWVRGALARCTSLLQLCASPGARCQREYIVLSVAYACALLAYLRGKSN